MTANSAENASLGAKFFQAGLGVWVKNPYPQGEEATETYRMGRLLDPKRSARPVYVPAKVVEVLSTGQIRARTEWEPKLEVTCTKEELFLANVCQDVDDMTNLAHLNDATLLDNVQTRYHRETHQQIYTMAGPILIAVNPYRIVTDRAGVSIYDKSYMDMYKSAMSSAASGGARSTLPPHIYGVASRAVATFAEERENQSIVISGESGAGKTESTKQIMQYVTCCSGLSNGESESSSGGSEGIESKLLRTNPVLEAIGNAKTVRNDNSSRFGKFIQIFMEPGNAASVVRIMGGSIQDFLLEKSRVVTHSSGERNYHVFYQLFAGLDESTRARLGLDAGVQAFRYLNPDKQREHAEALAATSQRGRADSRNRRRTHSRGADEGPQAEARAIDDLGAFEELRTSLDVVGLGDGRRDKIFKIIAGILHLGNIEMDDAAASSSGEEAAIKGGQESAALKQAAALFGVKGAALGETIVTKETSTGSQVISSRLDRKRAYDGVDALAKSMYGLLFRWVVSEINKTLCGSAGSQAQSSYIGILDIFGFEVFRQNGFEQFCINFANEKLHQLFTTHVFKLEQRIYEEEGIDYSAITFTDNQLVIDLIEKRPRGVLSLLDEACLFPQSTDDSFLSKLDQAHAAVAAGSSAYYRKATLRETELGPAFVVLHSAATVVYTVAEFLDKNRDRLESNVVRVMAASSCEVVSSLFREQQAESSGEQGSFTGSNAFLGSKFKDDINKLMHTLNATTPHFVRCLKANGEKRPGFMDPDMVLHQLRYLGVLDSIRIRHSGFSFRTSFAGFYSRFALVEPSLPSPAALRDRVNGNESDPLYRAKCKELVQRLWAMMTKASDDAAAEETSSSFLGQTQDAMVQFGTTRIFLRKQAIQTLEALRDVKLRAMDAAATRIQSVSRMRGVRAKIAAIRQGLERIRAAWAAVQDRRAWVHHMKVQETVRRTAMVWRARALLAHRKRALLCIQAFARMLRPRRAFLAAKRCARKAQGVVRSFILRKRFRMWMNVVTKIQSMVRSFLVRNRIYWRRVRGALALQAAWRGTLERRSMPQKMAVLAARRRQRARMAACRAIQRRWRSFLIRRRFLALRVATRALQRWAMGFVLSAQFKAIQTSTRLLQRMTRGFLARNLRQRILTARLLEDEMLEVNRVRYREAAAIEAANASPCCAKKARFQQRGTNRAVPVCKTATTHHAILDVDVRANVAGVYGTAWTDLCRRVEAASVDAGEFHSVALSTQGEVYTWGYGDRGQLGHGIFAARQAPGRLPALVRMHVPCRQVAAGSFHCMALTSDGRVLTWGAGSHGQLGHGTHDNDASPRFVEALAKRKVVQVGCGATNSAALTQSGAIYTWGGPGAVLGQGAFAGDGSSARPEPVRGLARERIDEIAMGRSFMLARARSGKLYSWGAGDHGQLGLGDCRDRVTPQELALPGERDCAMVVAGGRHAGAVDARGRLYLWGCNAHGQLGLGDTRDRLRPAWVEALEGSVGSVALGWRHSVASCGKRIARNARNEEEGLFAWGATSLPLPMAERARSTLLDSCVDEVTIFSAVRRVEANLATCGRRVVRLTSSKAPSMSFVGIIYEQRPATLAVHTSPLLGALDASTGAKSSSAVLHQTPGARKSPVDDAPTILVDGSGRRHDMASMSHESLQAFVRNLIASGPSARAFLVTDPEAAAKKQKRLEREQQQRTVHGVRYVAANSMSATRVEPRPGLLQIPRKAHAADDVGDEQVEVRFEGGARGARQSRTRASSVSVRRQRELEASIDVEALRAQARERERAEKLARRALREGQLDMAAHFDAKAMLYRRSNLVEHETKSKKPRAQSASSVVQSTAVMDYMAASLHQKQAQQQQARQQQQQLLRQPKRFQVTEVEDVETKSDVDVSSEPRAWKSMNVPRQNSSGGKPKQDEMGRLMRRLQARAERDVSAMWAQQAKNSWA